MLRPCFQPQLHWLYQRLISVNRFRYLGDLFRGTNFWSRPLPGVASNGAVTAAGPFAHAEGFKRGRTHPLAPSQPRAEQ